MIEVHEHDLFYLLTRYTSYSLITTALELNSITNQPFSILDTKRGMGDGVDEF